MSTNGNERAWLYGGRNLKGTAFGGDAVAVGLRGFETWGWAIWWSEFQKFPSEPPPLPRFLMPSPLHHSVQTAPNRNKMGNQIATTGDGTDVDELPAHYSDTNWPKGLEIKDLDIFLQKGHAQVKLVDGATLKPYIPLDQLARFLNDHVEGAVKELAFSDGGGEGLEDEVPRLLDEVTVPERLHTHMLIFLDFFHLPWAGIERILDGRTLRAKAIAFIRLQLPSGVDANELFKLPTLRQCPHLALNLSLPQLPGSAPLFDNNTLVEWLEQSDDRLLVLSSDSLLSGLLSFLDALKENFQQPTQVHSYGVEIRCPSINGVTGELGVRDEELFNQLGERMVIKVSASPTATEKTGHPIEALYVTRVQLD